MRLVTVSYAEVKHIYFKCMKLFSCLVRAENRCLPLSCSTSSKPKKRKSLVISNPIPCNTAFPADHVSIHSSAENTKDAPSSPPAKLSQGISEGNSRPEENAGSSKDLSDSDLSSAGSNTPKRQSTCDNSDNSDSESQEEEEEEDGVGAVAEVQEEEEAELATIQSDDSGVGVPKSDAAGQEVISTSDSTEGDPPQDPDQEQGSAPPSEEAQPKSAPVPVPRVSFSFKERQQETKEEENTADSSSPNPPGLLYKVQLCIMCIMFYI